MGSGGCAMARASEESPIKKRFLKVQEVMAGTLDHNCRHHMGVMGVSLLAGCSPLGVWGAREEYK